VSVIAILLHFRLMAKLAHVFDITALAAYAAAGGTVVGAFSRMFAAVQGQ
jgi:hypothetical protein